MGPRDLDWTSSRYPGIQINSGTDLTNVNKEVHDQTLKRKTSARRNGSKCFEKNRFGRFFLIFPSKVQNLTVFSIIYMIPIRCFRPRDLKQRYVSGMENNIVMGNTAQQCRLGLLQDSDFAGDLEDSKSTLGGILCIVGSHTFVPISWMCKKQTSVSHSSTESEIISLDAGLCMDGKPSS